MSGPYTKDEELRELSFQYIIDAVQLLTQAEILLNDGQLERQCEYHLGYLSKINVSIYMSIECSLKSLICATNIGTSPRVVYWEKIRTSGHGYGKLVNHIPNYSAILNSGALEADLSKLTATDVSERYCFEISAESDLLGKFNIDQSALSGKIQETRTLLNSASKLRQIVWNYRKEALENQRTLAPSAVKAVLKAIKTKLP